MVTANKKTILKMSNIKIKLNLTPPKAISPKSKIINLWLNKKVNKKPIAKLNRVKIKQIEKKKFIIDLYIIT